MRNRRTLEDCLHMWAANERHSLTIGYPHVSPGFQEYQAGYRISPRIPSQKELDMLSLIEKGIGHLRRWEDPRPYDILVEFYGAYPDAAEKNERMKRLQSRYKKRTMYSNLDKARLYLQGIIDTFLS